MIDEIPLPSARLLQLGRSRVRLSRARGSAASRRGAQKPTGPSRRISAEGQAHHLPVHGGRDLRCDTFEYKPQLQRDGGKSGPGGGTLTASKFSSASTAQTGTWFSELLPNMARHADKLCWLRGLHTDTPAHPQAVVQLHTGSANAALTRPSMGAWLLYGLGSENQDLPGYVTINPPPNFGGAVNYGSAFLPAHFQGTRINDTGHLPNLKPRAGGSLQRRQTRSDPGDEPRPGRKARRARPGGRHHRVVRTGVPHGIRFNLGWLCVRVRRSARPACAPLVSAATFAFMVGAAQRG